MVRPARRLRAPALVAVLLVVVQLLGGCAAGDAGDGATKVLLLGDSITQGKAGDWTWRYRLWQRLAEAGEQDVDLVGPADDLAHGSEDYRDPGFDRDHAAAWGAPLSPPAYDPAVLGRVYRPDVVVVELGVNDLGWQDEAPAGVAEAMRGTIETLRRAAPGVDVVLVHVPVVAVPGAEELNGRYDDLAEELDSDDERVVVAAAEQGFVSDPAAPDTDTYDGLHPNAAGEVKIASAVTSALAELGIGEPG